MSRERFEGWLKADSTLPVDRDGDGYIDMTVEIMWHTWKAAMAAETVPNVKIGNANVAVFDEAYVADLAEKAATVPAEVPMPEPAAYLYTLEYGQTVANKKVSLWKLNYPFGVCGADYLAQGDEGVSYVRETPLYAHGDAREAAGYARGLKDAAKDAKDFGGALNDAGWAFIEAYRSHFGNDMSAKLFNNVKPLLREAMRAYFATVAKKGGA